MVSALTAACAAPAYSLRFPVALPLVLLGLLDVVAVVVFPLLILLRNNVLSGLYVVLFAITL